VIRADIIIPSAFAKHELLFHITVNMFKRAKETCCK